MAAVLLINIHLCHKELQENGLIISMISVSLDFMNDYKQVKQDQKEASCTAVL